MSSSNILNITNSNPAKNQITLIRHLIMQQQQLKESTNDYTQLITSIQTACKYISSKVKKSGIARLNGQQDTDESQKRLDETANEIFINCLKSSGQVAIMVSEEEENLIEIEQKNQGSYVVCFDPIDGSTNIDANISLGSIFCIWKRLSDSIDCANIDDVLQSGKSIVAAGYCLYAASTQFVLAKQNEVNVYNLDPILGEFVLVNQNIQIPKKGNVYSVNEGNSSNWDDTIKDYINGKKFPKDQQQQIYSYRYIGSLVPDMHRIIMYGGIFLYPSDKKNTKGKLRILYEVLPFSFIIENAGGKAIMGLDGNSIDAQAQQIHDKCSIICGSYEDVQEVESLYQTNKLKKGQ